MLVQHIRFNKALSKENQPLDSTYMVEYGHHFHDNVVQTKLVSITVVH